MNIIVSGMDAVGKTYLCEKLVKKYGMSVIHSTSKTSNTLEYHLNLLDYHDNVFFDRFHTGEIIFPRLYSRDPKITLEDFDTITKRIIDNNDMYIIMYSSDPEIIKRRLEERGENTEWEIIPQIKEYEGMANYVKDKFGWYKNFYVCDIAEENAYDKLDKWIDENFGKVTTNIAYRKLVNDLLDKGHVMETKNLRGNTRELCNYMLKIDDLDTEYVSLKSGGTNLTYLAAELLWYWSARNDVKFIDHFASMWARVSDDGVTANSAYGYLLQKKHGFNQIEKIIELLKYDPYSRRAVININVPNENVIETKDEPCTVCLDYQIREGKLHCTCVMRSNDCRFGLLNDLGFFISLQKYIAKRLNIPVGTYTHFAMSIHFYDRDFKFVKDIAYGTMERSDTLLDIEKLLEHREELVNWVDNEFTSKEDFTNKLKEMNILHSTWR